jgi:hypothetical protein
MEYLLDDSLKRFDKNKIEDKRKISELLVDMIGSVTNSVEKSHWIKNVAQKLETTEAALTDILKKATLKNRLGKTILPEAEREIISRPKIEMLVDEAIGRMLGKPDVWKKAAEQRNSWAFAPKDSLLNILIEKGEDLEYNYEKLVSFILDKETKERAEKLFFIHKYQLGLNNELEEVELADPWGEFEILLNEIFKEEKREKLEKITADLKKAEDMKDKDAIKFLRNEFKNILEEVQKLS